MLKGLRMIAALALSLSGAVMLAACSADAQEPVPPEVRAVIERSRHPTTDYTSLHVDRVVSDGERFTATTAEYHRGTQHRIETRPTRTLIDCATGAAIVYDVRAGTTQRMEGGAGMCGIAAAEPVLSSGCCRRRPGASGGPTSSN